MEVGHYKHVFEECTLTLHAPCLLTAKKQAAFQYHVFPSEVSP